MRRHSGGDLLVMAQQEFLESREEALSWIRTVQSRLKVTDNTHGPRHALEARLRETEKISHSEHEGRLKMDMALVTAENLLQSADEELKTQTQVQLKELKSQWEETCTYITHCHSRIEWVWLHWSEYLQASEEFEAWLSKQQRQLDVSLELQLGVKEKLWQVDQQRVVVSDIHGQAALLERLLDEAAALHNRTQDPSMEPQAQERLQEAYNDVRDRAKERLALLLKMAEEHQTFQGSIKRFQSWLLTETKRLTALMEKQDTAEDKLKALQAVDSSIAAEEKTLQHIESMAEAVRSNTSPAGAEAVLEEAEELRLGWQRLRQGLCEAEEGLRSSLDSHSQYVSRCQRLGEDISRLRALMQRLDGELVQSSEAGGSTDPVEEQLLAQWNKYTGVRNTLTGEESQVELLKSQLKQLFRFSEDSRHLSDDVLAVVKEHQSLKCRASRLCSESELGLRTILQDPLLVYAQWSHMVSHVLENSADVTDFSYIAMLVQNIEQLLKDSVQLQERLSALQSKGDLLGFVFGPEQSDSLNQDLSAAIRNRELLHSQLLQRKSRLQGLISRSKDFAEAYKLIVSKMASLRDQLVAADGPQPDILAKKSQSDQFRVIQKDVENCEGQITALETLVSCSQSNRSQFERLYDEWTQLCSAVRAKVREGEDGTVEHENLHHALLNMEKWLMIMRQKLESFYSPSGHWSVEGRRHEAEKALGEFPEKELQLQQMEIQAQRVFEKTSTDGQVHGQRDLERLRESWLEVYTISLDLHRLLNSCAEPPAEPEPWVGGRRASPGTKRHEGGSSSVMAELSRSWTDGQQQDCLAKDNPGGDGGNAEEGLDLGGRAVTHYLATAARQHTTGDAGESTSRRKEFEAWLSKQSDLLSTVLSARMSRLSTRELMVQQDRLKVLRAGLGWGQQQFQLLLQEAAAAAAAGGQAEDVCLEELRYRWMLHKSKLKDVRELGSRKRSKRVQAKTQEEPAAPAKVPKKTSLLQRVCRLALPLWLLLLALLLLAFLLPLMDGGSSCSVTNNFARSFSIMLRYEGPPPT
ncbi:nesprin-3 isoform X2 [Takifugu rubripes]|uniref:nesprin-3 isoform X2 n=1 Tax=Takifugu rubripes TaxID=31033 RepID=UPI0005D13B34|nr:nesprin-3 isoform X2 [Takifugu rubripes]|eukprot:XP_011616901.1 PREDICTED: nesprin-3 isoform X2 [Takifugu rubripes]